MNLFVGVCQNSISCKLILRSMLLFCAFFSDYANVYKTMINFVNCYVYIWQIIVDKYQERKGQAVLSCPV